MIKRIKAESLIIGMFIHKLECKWTNHPFMLNRFKIKTEHELQKIRDAGIKLVQIDTEKGLDLILRHSAASSPRSPTGHETHFDQEMKEAQKITEDAREKITGILEDVKLGKNIRVDGLNPVVSQMMNSVFRNQNALACLGQIRSKDNYLFEHSVNIGVLMAVFGKFKGFSRDILDTLVMGAFLHDIGKIKVPNEILHKPGKLTRDEFEHMKKHVDYTKELLAQAEGIPHVAMQIAAEHHEKMDGTGYSQGLKGEEISLYGRMAGIVDVYDALTSTRCYKEGMPPSMVLKMMTDWGGSHLDTQLLHEFIRCVGVFPVGSLVELTDSHLAIVLENGKNPLRPLVRVVMHKDLKKKMSPKDFFLAESDLRIVDFADHTYYGINVADYYGN